MSSEKHLKSFGEFYSEVRQHFSNNVQDFEHFKRPNGGRKKIEFLLGHPEVCKALKNLQESCPTMKNVNESIARESPSILPSKTKLDSFKCSEKYPQLSAKVLIQSSKKKGRHLIAKEKILPGKIKIKCRIKS